MKMIDNIDKNILQQLEADARQSRSSIARQLGINKTIVTYRMNRMQDRGIISGYQCITNQALLGKVSYGLLFRFQDLALSEQEHVISKLRSNKTFDWITLTTGAWDAMAVVIGENVIDFKRQLNEVFAQYGAFIKEYSFYIDYAGIISNHNYLYNGNMLKPVSYGKKVGDEIEINEIEKQLLLQLRQHPTVSLLRVAQRLDKSYDTIHFHYQALLAKGIILKVSPVINHGLLGYDNTFCLMKLKPDTHKKEVMLEFCTQHPNVVRSAESLGYFDLVLNIHTANIRTLKEILADITHKFSDIVTQYDLIGAIDSVDD